MRIRHLLILLLAVAMPLAAAAPPSRTGPPRTLLGAEFKWEKQAGDWKLDATAATATATAGETLADLAASRSVALNGRWLSFKVALTGDAVKAGIRFSGIHDRTGDVVRLSLEEATGEITNGRGKAVCVLPESPSHTYDLLLNFSADKMTIHSGNTQLGEMDIKLAEPEATLSLFVERGGATFSEMLLAGDPLAVIVPMPKPAAPGAKIPPPPPAEKTTKLALDFTDAKMTALKSGWNDYFGIHYETGPGPWKSVRQPDGPAFGTPPRDRHTGEVKTFTGPFSGQPVQISLADFRDWDRKEAQGLDHNLPTLFNDERSALFIAPWTQAFTPAQQDQVWALMKITYGAHVGAEGRLFFQWGDEINYRRLGAAANIRVPQSEPRHGGSPMRGANAPDDAAAYAENFFVPAVEAIRMASLEIFRDERRIPVVLGSCTRASDPANREWYSRVMEHTLAGTAYKGRRVAELVDYLTVNYPFYNVDDATALQRLWDLHGKQVKGLWVTEDYGSPGRGAGTIARNAALFLGWAAQNRLDSQQARLFWDLPDERRDRYEARDFVRMLGSSFAGMPLRVADGEAEGGRAFRIAGGDSRMLIVFAPPTERRGKRPLPTGEITLTVTEAQAAKPWIARIFSGRDRGAKAADAVLPVARDGQRLTVKLAAPSLETWALIVETP